MIQMNANTHIILAIQPADFRKGIDGFVSLCQHHYAQNPRSGSVFAFINRSRTMIRLLSYDGSGYWLMTKRLSNNKFIGWPTGQSALSMIAAKHLSQLLRGSSVRKSTTIHQKKVA